MVKRSKIVLLLVYVLPWWCSITSALSPFPPALWFVVSGSQCTPPAPCSSGKQTSKPWAPQRDETEVLKEVQLLPHLDARSHRSMHRTACLDTPDDVHVIFSWRPQVCRGQRGALSFLCSTLFHYYFNTFPWLEPDESSVSRPTRLYLTVFLSGFRFSPL